MLSDLIYFCNNLHSASEIKSMNQQNLKPLIYLSTQEGIMANYRQVEDIWRVAKVFGRSVHVPSRYLPLHYGETLLNFCDIFTVPSGLTCTNKTVNEVAKYYPKCSIVNSTRINSRYTDPAMYGLPLSSIPQNTFNFGSNNLYCVAGYVYYNTVPGKRSPQYFSRHHLNPNYLKYLPLLYRILNDAARTLDATIIVYHWRRGDHLDSRCKKLSTETPDTSVNCKTVNDFVVAANYDANAVLSNCSMTLNLTVILKNAFYREKKNCRGSSICNSKHGVQFLKTFYNFPSEGYQLLENGSRILVYGKSVLGNGNNFFSYGNSIHSLGGTVFGRCSNVYGNGTNFNISKGNNNLIRYVATNEENETTLDYLRSQGFLVFRDIEQKIKSALGEQFELTRLNRFLLEILLMCHSSYFFSWGHSEVHNFIRACRRDRSAKEKHSYSFERSKNKKKHNKQKPSSTQNFHLPNNKLISTFLHNV